MNILYNSSSLKSYFLLVTLNNPLLIFCLHLISPAFLLTLTAAACPFHCIFVLAHTHTHWFSNVILIVPSPPSNHTFCSVDHNRIEVLTSATIERTLWCVSPFVRSCHCLTFYEQRVKLIRFSFVLQCRLFVAVGALKMSRNEDVSYHLFSSSAASFFSSFSTNWTKEEKSQESFHRMGFWTFCAVTLWQAIDSLHLMCHNYSLQFACSCPRALRCS